MNIKDEPFIINEITAEIDRVRVRASLPNIQFQTLRDAEDWFRYGGEQLILQVEARFLKREAWSDPPETTVTTENVPLTWVDAVKLRFFPAWMLKRWPAKYRSIATTQVTTRRHYHVCPHIAIPDQRTHVNFLGMNQSYTPPTRYRGGRDA